MTNLEERISSAQINPAAFVKCDVFNERAHIENINYFIYELYFVFTSALEFMLAKPSFQFTSLYPIPCTVKINCG
jgi:hypothetical protein